MCIVGDFQKIGRVVKITAVLEAQAEMRDEGPVDTASIDKDGFGLA
ncbi:hypothetical protein D0Y96_007725 [Acidipila sp. 4G-K13]|nr:hypothetical protein [Paracidobacterium acidisoli]